MKKENKGITLVALIITIIILIILSGVTINSIIGQDGLLKKAQIASQEYKKAQAKEELDIILMEIKSKLINEKGNIFIDDVENELRKNNDIKIKEINKEDLEIIVNYKNYDFIIDKDLNSELISSGIDDNLNISEEIKIILEKNNITEEDIRENNYEFTTINGRIEPIETITKVTINGKEIEFDKETGNINIDVTENGIYKIIAYGEEQKYNYAIVNVSDLTENLDIWTKEELVQFEKSVNNGRTYRGKTVRLKNDLDIGNIDWKPIGYENEYDDEDYATFYGTFDGENHTIKNMKLDSRNNENLNKCLAFIGSSEGIIKNLIFDNPYVYSEIYATAVVVAGQSGEGLIENVKILNGNVISIKEETAGICAWNAATISNCYSNCTISGTSEVGGICSIVGNAGIIQQCYNTGYISGTLSSIGGVCGFLNNKGTIRDCYNIGYVISEGKDQWNLARVGGIAGENNIGCNIINCYNAGDITAQYPGVGGIAGFNDGKSENVYNTGTITKGSITAIKEIGTKQDYLGTVVGGNNSGSLSGNYANTTIEDMKKWNSNIILENLGEKFKKNTNDKVNYGLPILEWQ